MYGFKGDVTLRRLNKDTYELVGDLSYSNHEIKVIAKGGMPTDGASIPRFLWRMYGSPFLGKYVCSALIHDALYTSRCTSKEFADDLFLEMMEVEGVSWWKRNSMYYAVKWFGSSAWNSIEEDGGKYCEIHYKNSIN